MANEGSRFSQHLTDQRADMPWAGEKFLPLQGLRSELGQMLCRFDPRQRSALGFPRRGTDTGLRQVALPFSDAIRKWTLNYRHAIP
jgi:hypothetical protein